jgi:hypothetical protein
MEILKANGVKIKSCAVVLSFIGACDAVSYYYYYYFRIILRVVAFTHVSWQLLYA